MRPERPQPPNDPTSREREQLATVLAIMLTVFFGGAFVLFLIFVTLGLFLWVILIAAGIAVYVGLHYLIWGRSNRTNEVTTEDEEPMPSENWPKELLDRRKPPGGPNSS